MKWGMARMNVLMDRKKFFILFPSSHIFMSSPIIYLEIILVNAVTSVSATETGALNCAAKDPLAFPEEISYNECISIHYIYLNALADAQIKDLLPAIGRLYHKNITVFKEAFMPRFFVETIDESDISLSGSDARHIGFSLRMKPGEPLTVCCDGIDYNCIIRSITGEQVFLDLVDKHRCAAEPDIEVTLFQAVPKLDKLEYIIQKSVELGAARIVPVLTRRCISRPDEKDFAKKLPRLQKISAEAAKQSGRGIIPEVTPIVSYKRALEMMKELDGNILLYEEEGGTSFSEAVEGIGKRIGLIIGSEGGFDREEAEAAAGAGAVQVWLGKRILRCETAPITALSILMFLTNNM